MKTKLELRSRWTDIRQSKRWLERLVPVLFCLVLSVQMFFSTRQLSQTADEATHLFAGFRFLRCGDLTVSPEHPPLAKTLAAVPLLSMDVGVDCSPFRGSDLTQAYTALDWLYSHNWRVALGRARVAISVFAFAVFLLVWLAARRMFDFAVAVVAALLLVFEPAMLAHGALIGTDTAAATMLLFAVFSFYLWVNNRTVPFLLLTGLAVGLGLLVKHSGVLVVPILCLLALADALSQNRGERTRWRMALHNLGAVALIFVLAATVVWVGYGLRFGMYPGAAAPLPPLPVTAGGKERVLHAVEKAHLLPQAYVRGLTSALSISRGTGPVYLLGKIYRHQPWFTLPVHVLIRSTAALLALIPLAFIGTIIVGKRKARELIFLLLPTSIYLAVCMRSSVSIRYLLPMLPLLLILVAAGSLELAKRVPWAKYALAALILLHAASSLHAFPNYLSYANEFWGGPKNGYKYLPWTDAGEAYWQAKAYLEQRKTDSCWLLTGWQWDPRLYDVPCPASGIYLPAATPPRTRGTVIVSSTLLTDVRPIPREIMAPFRNAVPKDHIGGGALLVYEGDFDTSAAASMSEYNAAVAAFNAGRVEAALGRSQNAVALAPESPTARFVRCQLLARSGQLQRALADCEAARTLAEKDPLGPDRLAIIEDQIQAIRAHIANGRADGIE